MNKFYILFFFSIVTFSQTLVVIDENNKPVIGASIFSENIEKAENIGIHKLNVGMCYINDFAKSDPELPFGGIKESGFGRELSINGFLEFVNIKTIVVNNT